MEEKLEFEFEPSKPLEGKGVTFASPVTSNSENKGDPLNFSPTTKIDEVLNSASNMGANAIAAGAGATAGVIARTADIRKFFEILLKKGVPPEQAMNLATTQVLTQAPTDMRPGAQPAGATSSQIMVPGKMTSGDTWAAKIGGPGGETADHAYENFRRRKTLGEGETLLRSGIALPPGTNVPGSTIPALLREEATAQAARESATAQAARESAAAKSPSRYNQVGNLIATTPSYGGKGLGIGLGGFAGYQGSKAYNDFNAAKNNSDKVSAAMDMLSAFGSGAAALPIPRAQIPGLALAAGIPALKYGANKMFGSPAKAADSPRVYPEKESDYVGEALTAGQLATGLAAVYPPAAPVAIPVGLGLGAIDFARKGRKTEALLNAEKIRQFESLGDPTEEEIQEAINSGAYRQRIRGRR